MLHKLALPALFAVVVIATTSQQAHGQPKKIGIAGYKGNGVLDTGFGVGGKATVTIPAMSSFEPSAAALDSQQRIVIVGTADNQFVVVRCKSSGDLDTSFNGTGYVLHALGNNTVARAVAVDSSDRILVTGEANGALTVLRYLPTGAADNNFGFGGLAYLDTQSAGTAIALQPDGKVVVAGTYNHEQSMLVARFTSNGLKDPSFSGGYIIKDMLSSPAVEQISGVAIDANGRIVVSGRLYTMMEGVPVSAFEVYRFANLTLDPTFNKNGNYFNQWWGASFEKGEGASAMMLDAAGRIVVTGRAYFAGNYNRFGVARVTASSDLDTTFGTAGVVTSGLSMLGDWIPTSIARWGSGSTERILVGGYTAAGTVKRFALAAYAQNGTLDPTFGGSGLMFLDFDCQGGNAVVAVAVQKFPGTIISLPHDRMLAIGSSLPSTCQ
jgi:uncharacterized delta-60 repeat protein